MKKEQILAKLKEVQSGQLIDWQFQTVADDTEVIVRYGWDQEIETGSIFHNEWVILVGGDLIEEGDPWTEGLELQNMETIANYLQILKF